MRFGGKSEVWVLYLYMEGSVKGMKLCCSPSLWCSAPGSPWDEPAATLVLSIYSSRALPPALGACLVPRGRSSFCGRPRVSSVGGSSRFLSFSEAPACPEVLSVSFVLNFMSTSPCCQPVLMTLGSCPRFKKVASSHKLFNELLQLLELQSLQQILSHNPP